MIRQTHSLSAASDTKESGAYAGKKNFFFGGGVFQGYGRLVAGHPRGRRIFENLQKIS